MAAISIPTEPLLAEMTAWRHDFHRHPELGFDEHRTSANSGSVGMLIAAMVRLTCVGIACSCTAPRLGPTN